MQHARRVTQGLHGPDRQLEQPTLLVGQPRGGEFARVDSRGHTVWLQATYTPIGDPQGRIFKIIKFASDVSAARRQALEDDAKIAAISRSQGVVEFDLAGLVLDANENFLRLFGYEDAEVVGKHHRTFVDPGYADSGEYRAFWAKLGRGEFDSGEYLRFAKDGTPVWIQASSPLCRRAWHSWSQRDR